MNPIEKVARAVWAKDNPGKNCPPDRIPTESDLAAWLPEFPEAAHLEAGERLAALYGLSDGGGCRWKQGRTVMGKTWRSTGRTTYMPNGDMEFENVEVPNAEGIPVGTIRVTLNAEERPGPDGLGGGSMGTLEEVHKAWRATPDEHRPKHPLAPLVKAWQERPTDVKPDRSKKGIFPMIFIKRTQSTLPGLVVSSPPNELPGLVKQPAEQATFPWLEPVRKQPAILALFDQAGGRSGRQRGIAPVELRCFVEALIASRRQDRNGGLHRIRPFTIREIAGEWLQWNLKHYRPGHITTGRRLQEGLRRMRDLYIPIGNEGGFYFPLLLSGVSSWGLHGQVSFLSQMPRGSEVGPSVNRNVLRVLGKLSEPAYRAYLALCIEWDRYGGHKGKLILPTQPIAKRDNQRHILDARGQIVTGKGGVAVKSPYDKRGNPHG